jgi:alpha-tubulin suppressor-like RCC1 family protein
MSFRYAAGINKPGFDPLAAGVSQYKGIWNISSQANAKGAGTWPVQPPPRNLYAWGGGQSGQLGLGNITDYSSPKQVGSLITWYAIDGGGGHVLSTKTDGTLWAWGQGNNGALGLGNTTGYSSPKQVGALTTWANISAGQNDSSLATKTDGTLWSWGLNHRGQLGLGNTTSYSSPKQVGSLTTWLNISQGDAHTLATKTDGTLWSWGNNLAGQLGLGNTTAYSSPKQVGALTTWLKVAGGTYMSTAIKTNGSLWVWGGNFRGQLGLGNTTYYSSPKQVGALTNWLTVACGEYFSIAVKTDGTLWSWGNGGGGRLGLNNTTNYSSPKQIGALTTWQTSITSNTTYFFAGAIKTDGSLWVWGDNALGQLGLGNITNYSSPKQVGASLTWSTPAMTNRATLAISSA